MVEYRSGALDRTFAALSDPTRRALIARLRDEPDLSVSELAQPHRVSLQAIIKHLDVLADAGLLTRTKTGRIVRCRLRATPMEDAVHWLQRYERFGSDSFDALAAVVETQHRSHATTRPRKKK
jgi:DNA-binding transcriptional ArsR family regulator